MTRQLKNRMAVGGIVHETVSFLPEATTLADFERRAVRGDKIAEAFAGSNTVFGGFLDVCQQNGVAVEGLISAECAPSGPVSKEAIQALADELVSRAILWRDETTVCCCIYTVPWWPRVCRLRP